MFAAVIYFSLWLPGAYKRTVHPFRMEKCNIEVASNPKWEIPASDDIEKIEGIFSAPFTYFSKGKQSYVFLSHDKKYVLKLFRFDTCRMQLGQKMIRILKKKFLNKEKEIKRTVKASAIKTFNSSYLCYTSARDLTGVVFVHLNPQKEKFPDLIVKDRLGFSHKVDAGRYRFVLQRKADPLLKTLARSEHPEELIDSYRTLLEEFRSRGMTNEDPKLSDNFGVLDGKVVSVDIGNFSYTSNFPEDEVAGFMKHLNDWLKKQ